MSRNVEVSFFSETPIENIEAQNTQASALLDAETGEMVFQVPIRGFHFEKALMEEHFNENYICLLYTSPSPRDRTRSRMPSSA